MKGIHSQVGYRALCGLTAVVLSLGILGGQPSNATGDAILVKGPIVSAKGPLAAKTIIVMPIETAVGKPVTLQGGAYSTLSVDGRLPPKSDTWIYNYKITGDPRLGPRLNPEAKTDAKGSFSVQVSRDLLKRFKAGVLAIGVFEGITSTYEPEIISYEESATTVDIGKLLFKPMSAPKR